MRRGTVELPVAASRDSTVPLAAQIAAQLRTAMTEGRLKGGERLPGQPGTGRRARGEPDRC